MLEWDDLTDTFGQDLAPHGTFVITTVFSITSNTETFTMTNAATVTGVVDVFDNDANDDSDDEFLSNVPTAVELLYFNGEYQAGAIILSWATAVELDNYGFSILRSTTGSLADAEEIALVRGQGHGTASGASYTYTDKNVESSQTYTYWLVDIDFDGKETIHDPVTVDNPGINIGSGGSTIYLPIIIR